MPPPFLPTIYPLMSSPPLLGPDPGGGFGVLNPARVKLALPTLMLPSFFFFFHQLVLCDVSDRLRSSQAQPICARRSDMAALFFWLGSETIQLLLLLFVLTDPTLLCFPLFTLP